MMRRLWLVGGVVAGAAAGVMVVRRLRRSGYELDEIDSAAGEGEFGYRGAPAPEQRWAPAETRAGQTPEQLAMAARIGQSMAAIRTVWPTMTEEEITGAHGDIDRLAQIIAEKVEQPRDLIRRRLDEIIARETPRPSYPAH